MPCGCAAPMSLARRSRFRGKLAQQTNFSRTSSPASPSPERYRERPSFVDRQPPEVSELHDLLMDRRQRLQGIVERNEIELTSRAARSGLVDRVRATHHHLASEAPRSGHVRPEPFALIAPAMAEEVGSHCATEFDGCRPVEENVSLHQGRRLQGHELFPLTRHLFPGQPPQFVIYERCQFFHRRVIPQSNCEQATAAELLGCP